VPIVLDKPDGWTPLDALTALRACEPELANARLGYAGRLDPMAEGVLLVLRDDENNDAARYRALDKEYVVRVLFGFATDTYDALGLVDDERPVPTDERVRSVVVSLPGRFEQPWPPYSARRVHGRAMYYWARRGGVPGTQPPATARTLHTVAIVASGAVARSVLRTAIETRVTRVRGDFRQPEIVARWSTVLAKSGGDLPWFDLRVHCSSGTYMRSLAHRIGTQIESAAIALHIVRERVGEFRREEARKLGDATGQDGAPRSSSSAT